jgi:hypothetical protein
VSPQAPEGWAEVYGGPFVQGDLIRAVLEARGIQAVTQRLAPESVFSGLDFERCVVFVPAEQAERARVVLAEEGPLDNE